MTDNMNLVKDAFRNFLSEYQTEKKDATLADLGTRVNRIVRDMARLNKLAEENAAELEEINKKRETYAAAVVDAELAEVRARQQARVQRFANDLLEAVVFVQNNIDAVTQNIPFDIAAPDFQAVLSVIFASGKHLPIEKQTDFIKQYRGNRPALSILKGIYQNYGYTNSLVVDAFKDAETTIDNGVLETISRAAGRAVYSGTWEPPMLHNARAVHEFAVRYGINTTENPLITELKETGQKVDGVKYIVRGAIDAITEAEADSPAEARRIFDEAMVRISAIGKRKDITNQQQTVAN